MARKYRIKVKYVFEGDYLVTAKSRQQAREIVKKSCGATLGGGIHTSEPRDVVDWDFNTHPLEIIR